MERGKVLTDLERFDVTRNGKPFKAIDFNFWGVTFRDDRRFYASLQSAGDIYLVEGDVETRKARVVDEGVECPSLSPNGRRIAFKKRQGNRWRLHVLQLGSGRKTPLAELRSVDDQVEWLDDGRILYALEGDLWVVRADGRGRPRIYREDALSPAVVFLIAGQSAKAADAFSASILPIASEAVAPGDGALRTCSTPSASSSRKSSTSFPSELMHCARIPDGPNRRSLARTRGTYRRNSRTNAHLT
jgi:dipeptidyl aminopeptidase/acylaminoacyl peptidase